VESVLPQTKISTADLENFITFFLDFITFFKQENQKKNNGTTL
jgi:hypothetical protein